MALSFNKQKGSAQGSLDMYKYKDGVNTFRLVGDIVPRYMYWIKHNGKDTPMECLAFDRDTETWARAEKDWVRDMWDASAIASWSYATQCLVEEEGQVKVKVLPLKKKLWEQIIMTAEDLGDPTDIEEGWDVVFKRVKTGSLAFNVEYQLQQLKCTKRPLNDQEREAIKGLKSMDEIFPRDTPDQQRQKLENMRKADKPEMDSDQKEELDSEFDID